MPDESPVENLAFQHLGLILAAALALVTTLRLFRVAHGSITTALAIVQHAGTGNVAVGLLLQLLPIVPMSLGAGYLALRRESPASTKRATLALAFLISAALLPLAFGLIVSAVGVVAVLSTLLAKKTEARKTTWDTRLSRLAVGLMLLALVSIDSPWLPAEEVQTAGRVEVGYVLSADARTVVLLRDRDRQVVFIPADAVDRQVLCVLHTQSGRWNQSLLGAGNNETPQYPKCSRP